MIKWQSTTTKKRTSNNNKRKIVLWIVLLNPSEKKNVGKIQKAIMKTELATEFTMCLSREAMKNERYQLATHNFPLEKFHFCARKHYVYCKFVPDSSIKRYRTQKTGIQNCNTGTDDSNIFDAEFYLTKECFSLENFVYYLKCGGVYLGKVRFTWKKMHFN